MPFPPFSDYQETFSAPLPASTWATFTPPSWLPSPAHLTRLAKVVYPYWRERRTERGGHRIISILNYDETDSQNESYICFRHREIKAVRKTRASQVTSSDKLLRLQSELLSSLDLAKNVLSRENIKRDTAKQAQNVWEKRFALVDLKRRFPTLGVKEDEELLHDKERVPKRPRVDSASAKLPGLRIRTYGGDLSSPSAHTEIAIRPKDRTAAIQSSIEHELMRQKDRDYHWEDQIDVGLSCSEMHPFILTCACRMSISPNQFRMRLVSSNIFVPLGLSQHHRLERMKRRRQRRYAYVVPVVAVGLSTSALHVFTQLQISIPSFPFDADYLAEILMRKMTLMKNVLGDLLSGGSSTLMTAPP